MKRAIVPALCVVVAAQCVQLPNDPLQLIIVEVTTVGSPLDLDGYTVTVDGRQSQVVEGDGTVTFTDLAPGEHMVELGGLATNCTIGGANPRVVTVTEGGVVEVPFAVMCTETGPGMGILLVQATTTGSALDSDGYVVTVDGDAVLGQMVGPNATVVFAGLTAGAYVVALSGVANNCAVADNPQAVVVAEGGVVEISFAVTCTETLPGTGSVLVQATTTGNALDADGYSVIVDGDAASAQTVGPNGSVVFSGLAAGEHMVAISGVAANCTVAENPRAVTVGEGGVLVVPFAVACTGNASLLVRTTTAGNALDVDGFTVTVDGDAALSQAVGPNGSVVFAGLGAGEHLVALSGVAANCTVVDNPRAVTVTEGGIVEVPFAVTCVAGGGLLVQTTTTGSALDPDGYLVTVDGNAALSQAVGPNGSVVFPGLAAGEHVVALGGVAANCSVSDNPRVVMIGEGGVVEATFAVTCTGPSSLLVRTTTTGSALDPDGYSVTVDGDASLSQAVGPNGSVVFAGLAAGEHVVALSGVAANCAVVDNPRLVTVAEGGVVEAPFVVTCVGTGWLLVQATTTGSDLDTDGYTATVDEDATLTQGLEPNGSAAFAGLVAGEHVVALSDVAANCSVAGANPRTVTVSEGGVVEVPFEVACVGAGGLVVQATTTGSAIDADGYTVTLDGDGALAEAVGPNSSVAFADLSVGEHTLLLSGVAANCTVSSNPQVVNVSADATVHATFLVTCTGTGSLVVQATTTGDAVDSDGYLATLDGDASLAQTIGPNGSVVFEGLTAGDHSVLLSGVADNCTVSGTNPRTVVAANDATVHTSFSLHCEGRSNPAGSLEIGTTTTGTDLDPDGYTVTVEGDPSWSEEIGPNGAVLFEGLPVGDHQVRLSGVADNCRVLGASPRTVTVLESATVRADFEVTCGGEGWLVVSVSTSGSDWDVDGYTVTVDGEAALTEAVGPNGSVVFEGLTAGEHSVTLSGVAANCAVEGPNPRLVSIPTNGVVEVTVPVSCVWQPSLTGSLKVKAITTGHHQDPDGYTATVDGTVDAPVPSNGWVIIEDVLVGQHTVRLAGIAGNCAVHSENPQTVLVEEDALAYVTFSVYCER